MASSFVGRWDLTVGSGDAAFPSWLELTEGATGWSGRLVGVVGSARPIPHIEVSGSRLSFSLPPQYEGFPGDMAFEADLVGDTLQGTTNTKDGGSLPWVGVRQPEATPGEPVWGEPIELIGCGMAGWVARWPQMQNNWSNVDGALQNSAVGTDLISEASFGDFQLLAEYSYPKGSNSGIYLRGRYEFQVLDDYGSEPSVGGSGGIYGFLTPRVNAIRPFGERNTLELTLVGRTVSAKLNGKTLYENDEIPGITGGALDSREGEPGPILIQGDHGPVTYHRLRVTPRVG